MDFRCIFRLPGSWRRWSQAGLLLTGCLYAAASLLAEAQFAAGWSAPDPQVSIAHLRRAQALFPLEHRLRLGLAEFYSTVRFKGSSLPAIVALAEALDDDPWNAGLRRNLAGFLIEAGNEEAAQAEIAAVHRISPRSNIALRVNVNPETR